MEPRERRLDDARGIGLADAAQWRPVVDDLSAIADTPGWVAEEPELHLLPHLQQGAETVGVEVLGTATNDATFDVDLRRGDRSGAQMRMVTMALVSTIAEASTHVRQVSESEFEVVTGMLEGDSPRFAPHGHVLRFRFV